MSSEVSRPARASPKVIFHTDNSLECGGACEDQVWVRTSTPRCSETSGVAELAVRRVREGTSAILLKSGLGEIWLADSFPWSVIVVSETFNTSFRTGKLHMDCVLENYSVGHSCLVVRRLNITPISAKDLSRLHSSLVKRGPAKHLHWLRVVCGRNLERRHLWSGSRSWKILDASEFHARRLNAKEVLMPMHGEESIFPFADE